MDDKSQAYFWTVDWQETERAAQADIDAVWVQTFDSVESLRADLDDENLD